MTTVPISVARAKLAKLVNDVDQRFERVAITKSGKAKAVLMSSEEFEDWQETIEILSDREAMKAIRAAEKERHKPGSWASWDIVKRQLDLP